MTGVQTCALPISCKSRLIEGNVNHPKNLDGITDEELANGYILTCVAVPTSDIEIESDYYPELDGIDPVISPCKVNSIEFPAHDIAILNLRLPPTSNMKYLPGQYIDLEWKGVQRSYSIANMLNKAHGLELHIRRVPNGKFSDLVFNELKQESLLRLNGPHGTFFVRNTDAPIIFLAGGTGFAPVKAMVEQLLEKKTGREVYIYWGNSTVEGFYSSLPKCWAEENSNITYIPVYSENNQKWKERKGLVHQAVLEDISNLKDFEVYTCGSPNMIKAAKSDFLAHGLLEKNFFADAFTPFKQTK